MGKSTKVLKSSFRSMNYPSKSYVCSMEELCKWWADLCLEEIDKGSTREQGTQEPIPNAIVLVDEDMVNPFSVLGSGNDAEEKNCLIEETVLEIAWVLGITVEGRNEGIRACIRKMIDEEFGLNKGDKIPKSKKKLMGYKELTNLASSINYDLPVGKLSLGVKLLES